MIDFITSHKKTVVAIILIAVGFIVYGIFFVDSESGSGLTSTTNQVAAVAGGEEILELLGELQDINLDTTLFELPEFNGLIDFSVTLTPQPVGRTNPFAPLGGFVTIPVASPPATTTDPTN